MRSFRIVKRAHAADAFTGEGARRYGGRWNLPGFPVVYCAQTRALAALESLAHYQGAERMIRFVTFEVEVPDALVETIEAGRLPPQWRASPPSRSTQVLGSEWQAGGRSVALRVPSVLIPEEYCVLLDPAHPDVKKVVISYPVDFSFDSRF